MIRSHRRASAALLAAVLLTACAGESAPEPEDEAQQAASPSASAPATAASESPKAPPAIEGLVVVEEDLEREHREGTIEYDTLPPVGGPHNPRWLACDVYDEPVPAEFAVHSLEHGAVWFAHAPGLDAGDVDRLADLAERNPEYVLVSPLEGLDSRIVAVAWGASLEASSADDPRLEQFLEAYAGGGQGGEPGAPCRSNGLSLREARGMIGSQA